jgi:7-cyano-7-deazaguanine synthase
MSIAIISGGMDSITMLHEFKQSIDLALTFNYGQKHLKELHYAGENCMKLKVEHLIISLLPFAAYLPSALTSKEIPIPEGHYEDETMKQTVVPFRNGIMLSIAAGIAEAKGIKSIMIAAHAGDHAIYPDCRKSFIEAFSDAISLGTYLEIKVEAPYLLLTKRQIALKGKRVGVDFTKTWSCYKGEEFHCGKCGTCVERREALNGFDLTKYLD